MIGKILLILKSNNLKKLKRNMKTISSMKITSHSQKYTKDIKIFQHMILITSVIYQNHLYQIMIICNIHQHMFIITEIYGNTSDSQKKKNKSHYQ